MGKKNREVRVRKSNSDLKKIGVPSLEKNISQPNELQFILKLRWGQQSTSPRSTNGDTEIQTYTMTSFYRYKITHTYNSREAPE